MAAKGKNKASVDESAGFGLNLGALLQAKGMQTPQQQENTAKALRESDPAFVPIDLAQCGRVVLREERKGRGGKTVTVLRGVVGSQQQLEELCQRMRRALGCGGNVEESEFIILQGEQMERARMWLEQQGVRDVVLGTRPKKS